MDVSISATIIREATSALVVRAINLAVTTRHALVSVRYILSKSHKHWKSFTP